MATTLHVKRSARLRFGAPDHLKIALNDDGSAVAIYGGQPSASFASLRELLELHGVREVDLEERTSAGRAVPFKRDSGR